VICSGRGFQILPKGGAQGGVGELSRNGTMAAMDTKVESVAMLTWTLKLRKYISRPSRLESDGLHRVLKSDLPPTALIDLLLFPSVRAAGHPTHGNFHG